MDGTTRNNDQKVIDFLGTLYRQYGYQPYKVTKFEEYDLYVQNKNFLVSDRMLTFTDTNGKLMALKPDITLSIVKNARPQPGDIEKVCYCENVFRTAPGHNGFQEITQVGLECLGALDDYTLSEVIMLACRSLATITDRYQLQVSHAGFLDALLSQVPSALHGEILQLIRSKNVPALKDFCLASDMDRTIAEQFLLLSGTFGPLHAVLPSLTPLLGNEQTRQAWEELNAIDDAMVQYGLSDHVYLDFSVINDLSYYNGILFQGYVDGLHTHILAGGRYDRLMEKMGKQAAGMGFAVYVSLLERFWVREETFDGDVLLMYDDTSTPLQVAQAVESIAAGGKSVKAARTDTGRFRCRETVKLQNGGIAP